jgi:hypothetical protein
MEDIVTVETVRVLNELRDGAGWNQRQRVLWALNNARTDCTEPGVICASVFLQSYMPRYAVAISWLRSRRHLIDTGWCKQHRLGTYRLL